MNGKGKIKVIKKGQAKIADKPAVRNKSAKQAAAARDMVSTVTHWVSDFQHRKREETRTAIEKFFNQHPQTSGA